FRFSWASNIFEVGVSIGIVPINDSVVSITDLLSAADSACYVAKEKGRNAKHIYISGDKALAQHHGQMKWYQRIQHALDEERFELYMQEIKPVNGNMSSHAEILLRMNEVNGSVVSPIKFLPTAERYHMIMEIDRWVIRSVLSIINKPDSRLALLKGVCAINLSGQSLGHEIFLDYVLSQFELYKVDGNLICFEITETAVISNISQARKFMHEMKKKGCKFSLDDFGSGLSSFSYLKNLDVDYLKIDGSFVKNILNDKHDYNMVSTINHLGHSLGLKTIAEYVENSDLATALQDMGVDYIQGYAIDMPSPVIPGLFNAK
ncbi:MAG: EAL domain-containing protein, partial [Gammaproteobacteria bacterium]|nr:EAL domain-containing protein [Gammaproteobacteria bacterium]